jgi:hypothetical protein
LDIDVKQMMRNCLIPALLLLAIPSSAFAQTSVTLEPATARFTYFPSPEGPGIPGGVPDPFELHFGMQGTFVVEELPNNTGDITQANFILLGNDAAFQNDPARRAAIEETARQILLDAMFSVERGPPLDRTVFRAGFPPFGRDLTLEFFRQTLVRMDGGPDSRPVDGNGVLYTYPVPEPPARALLLIACACGGIWRMVIVARRP